MEMTLKPWVLVIIIAGLIFFHMSLMSNAEQSDVEKGKVLFNDPSLGEITQTDGALKIREIKKSFV
jgi:hypothetical protein